MYGLTFRLRDSGLFPAWFVEACLSVDNSNNALSVSDMFREQHYSVSFQLQFGILLLFASAVLYFYVQYTYMSYQRHIVRKMKY